MYGVIINIAQKHANLVAENDTLVTAQAAEYFPERPDGLAQQQHLAFEMMYAVDRILTGLIQQFKLQVLNRIAEFFQNQKIIVDQRIYQGIGQVVWTQSPDAAATAQPFANAVKDIARFFLKRQYVVVANHQAYLFEFNVVRLVIELQHLDDDIQVFVVDFDFGSVIGVQDVFLNQWVQLEAVANFTNDVRIVQSVNIEPAGDVRGFWWMALCRVRKLEFFQAGFVISNEPDIDIGVFCFTDVDKGPGRGAHFFAAFFDQLCRVVYTMRFCHVRSTLFDLHGCRNPVIIPARTALWYHARALTCHKRRIDACVLAAPASPESGVIPGVLQDRKGSLSEQDCL